MTFLKLPFTYNGRSRSNKRADSRTESSGANTPDPLSPHAGLETPYNEAVISPVASPPVTPLSINIEDNLSSISVGSTKKRITKELIKITADDVSSSVSEYVEKPPYEKRKFPLHSEMYGEMLKNMPKDHQQWMNNVHSQNSLKRDCYNCASVVYHDSESTESAYEDDSPDDPNDPEWIEMETVKELVRSKH